mmetsp:Transcript_9810/g.17746  ORF Transcript_9810/g.17746 Transcript_9810/m.17746 type:complete len:85 (-) Transcript_9810:719-973(-)
MSKTHDHRHKPGSGAVAAQDMYDTRRSIAQFCLLLVDHHSGDSLHSTRGSADAGEGCCVPGAQGHLSPAYPQQGPRSRCRKRSI